ncbi:hypothetical protein SDC9_172690 [bioreactor metagenome]|uniref:Uncharacterized protein n=1 Tax=bioreactor metagenome TaxID=1076179 RepID=A0A645GNL1_9ZZZZ
MFGKVIIDNQGVHAIIHEPFAHGGAGERSQVLIRCRVRCGGSDDDGVGHGAGLFEHRDYASNIRLFLADRHVDAIKRAIVLLTRGFSSLV